MADEAPPSTAAPQDDLAVSIAVVSPSLAVNSPLTFPGLPSSTTIGQIKQSIRDALDSKPSNAHQRLIHQGKLLAREQETLLDVFGEQKLRDTEQLVLHLVIREAPSADHHPSPSQTAPPRGQSPARHAVPGTANPFTANAQGANAQGANAQGSSQQQPPAPPGFQPGRFVRGPMTMTSGRPPPPPFGPMQVPPGTTPAQLAAHQQELLHNYMHHFNQRPGGAAGQQPTPVLPGQNTQGSNSPHARYSTGVGPHGEAVRYVTVSQTIIGPNGPVPIPTPMAPGLQAGNTGPPAPAPAPAPAPGGTLAPNDVHNILRNADASEQASSIWGNAMQRSASGASLPNLAAGSHRQPIPTPGVTVPWRPGSTAPLSRTATPDATGTPSHESTAAAQSQGNSAAPANQPEVYILSSPQGPRALLFNGPLDMYYTAAYRAPRQPFFPDDFTWPEYLPPRAMWPPQPQAGPGVDAGQPQAQPQPAAAPADRQPPLQGNVRVGLYQGAMQPTLQEQQQLRQRQRQHQQLLQQQHQRLQQLAPGAAAMHPANPDGGVAGALMAALWPHLWLMIRLTVFVWWFTSADTSWTRWATVLSIAIAIFVVNTGVLNNLAHDVLNPLRQHLEGLIPFGGIDNDRNRRDHAPAANANAAPGQNANNGAAVAAGAQRGEPDPAQAAARLMEQRRLDNGNWLLDQIRRLERAGLLFLASIAPGVAERHIANMEAAERAERERQEAAERAERERLEEQERGAAEASTVDAAAEEGESASRQSHGEATAHGTGAEQHQQPAVVN